MQGSGLPPGFDLLFSDEEEAARHVLAVDLPPGRLVEPQQEEDAWNGPAYWLSDEPAGPDLWVRLRQAHARSGLWLNYIQPPSLLSSVLRSWEERFGARLTEVGFDQLHLTVAAPPVSPAHAERVAAEHFAFCPDNIVQGTGTIRAYADKYVLGKADWWFWWD
jgi:hypothetical protein